MLKLAMDFLLQSQEKRNMKKHELQLLNQRIEQME